MANQPVRVGIIGAGIMGRIHAEMLQANPESEVVAVTSRTRRSAERLAADFAVNRVYDDHTELLEDDDIDLVTIATPDHLHAGLVIATARAGRNLVVEKPFTTSLSEADEALDVVRESGVAAMTLFNHRWVPAYAQAKELIDGGGIGEFRLGYARKNDRIYVPTEMIAWAADTTPAWFLSSHDIDLMCWYADDVVTEVHAYAVAGKLSTMGVATPDAVQAQVRFREGGVATFEACWIYPDTFPTMTDSFVEVVGTEGVIHMDRKTEQIEIAGPHSFEYPRNALLATVNGRPAGAVYHALAHVVDCVQTGQKPLVDLETARHVTAILEAIHRSIETGDPQSVDAGEEG